MFFITKQNNKENHTFNRIINKHLPVILIILFIIVIVTIITIHFFKIKGNKRQYNEYFGETDTTKPQPTEKKTTIIQRAEEPTITQQNNNTNTTSEQSEQSEQPDQSEQTAQSSQTSQTSQTSSNTQFIDTSTLKYDKPVPTINSETSNLTNINACNTPSELVSLCMNYEGCCKTYGTNNKCFCDHPAVQQCYTKYSECINDPTNKSMYGDKLSSVCKTQNNECCKMYNSIQINSNNFKDPIYKQQLNNVICSFSSVPNISQKCMEICQTNPKCKAYLLNESISCTLFDNVNEDTLKIDPISGKASTENKSYKFYVKK
jgi:hypothetical protein